MANLLRFPPWLEFRDQHSYFDDFIHEIDALEWVITATDSGTGTVGGKAGGILDLVPSDGTPADNDEIYAESPNETYRFAAGKPLVAEARVRFAEGAANQTNLMFGLMDAVAADSLLDNGGGPRASYDGAVIYKVDGGAVWRAQSARGATKTDSISVTSALPATWYTLRIEVADYTTLLAQVTYFVDGVQLVDSNNLPIVHTVAYASNVVKALVVAQKQGSTSVDTSEVDYIGADQVR